ncbi:hypothetical protein [Paenibacillus sedimenti]|uniref:Uncharacterized protein n=1 Tax=Paenibacillus sedimenti TaxID=2770274 RepID=A0A926KZ00_9BACL|nr:hypothetical protein [Paenibacillus sedimenti]MBD0384833.1 hypothetical protein [Paenibacillus sedimenti]
MALWQFYSRIGVQSEKGNETLYEQNGIPACLKMWGAVTLIETPMRIFLYNGNGAEIEKACLSQDR